MAAEIDIVGERLAEVFGDTLSESGLDLTVSYQYDTDDAQEGLNERKVYILPFKYNVVEPVDRTDKNTFDVMFTIYVVERYGAVSKPTQRGKPPKAWVQERTEWVQEKIYNPLCNTNNPLKIEIGTPDTSVMEYWSQAVEMVEIADIGHLRENRFWSELEVTLRRIY